MAPLASSTLVIGLGVLGVSLDIAGKALMAAGIIKLLGIAPMLAGSVGGLVAVLTGPLGLVLAAGAAAAAIDGLIYALSSHTSGQKDTSKKGQDIGLHRGNNPLVWVQDTSGRGGNLGHWIGKGSGAANSMHTGADGGHYSTPLAGMRINPDYMPGQALPYIAPPKPQPVVIQGGVYIDGKAAGKLLTPTVTNEQVKAAGRPNTGTNTFNGSMSMPSIGSVR